MTKNQPDKKNATTETQKKDETQKFSVSNKFSDSVVAREISELKQKVSELEEKYKRALADYQNLEKRSLEERKAWIKTSNRELILRLLPILDTLMLASKHSQDQSLKVAIQQFLEILKQEGVEKVETENKEFDPTTMECIQTQEGEEGKVLEELRTGYTMNGHLLRVAQVKVGKLVTS